MLDLVAQQGFSILQYPHPILRDKCKDIVLPNDSIGTTVNQMLQLLRAAGGIGLSAPQIGLSWRVFVLNMPTDELVYINPKIIAKSFLSKEDYEGCLSLKDKMVKVKRSSVLTVEAFDQFNRKFRKQVSGLLARCIQHEMDHLNGKLILDYEDKSKK